MWSRRCRMRNLPSPWTARPYRPVLPGRGASFPLRHADRAGYRVRGSAADSVADMTVSISVTLDDDLGDELNAAVAGSNRSAMVADAIREYLDRRAVAAAAAWHASLAGEDAAVFAEFNAAW